MDGKLNFQSEGDPVALHVLVVGFHHKKGMQVEYAYPPLGNAEDGCELPEKWKYLPSLCLPDGAHNHEADTIYFHLPHLHNDTQTVFGVSCYRQIDAEKVTNKTADITRNTVQKSVCVLTTLPIYGYVQERLKVTTKVYFKGADFSDVRDLEGLYHDLNNTNWKDRLLHGICVSEAVRIFGRNILVLFKLLLLERKVLFFHSPVAPIGQIITSLLALLPANLPEGLAQAAATSNECEYLEEILEFEDAQSHEAIIEEGIEPSELDLSMLNEKLQPEQFPSNFKTEETTKIINVTPDEGLGIAVEASIPDGLNFGSDDASEFRSSASSLTSVTSRGSLQSPYSTSCDGVVNNSVNFSSRMSSLKGKLSGALSYWTSKEKMPIVEKASATTTPNPSPSEPGDDTPVSPSSGLPFTDFSETSMSESSIKSDSQNAILNAEKYSLLEPLDCGLPLQIFTKGNLLHPYLSLQYLDVLTSPSTRAFIAGASNALFIHKKNLYEVVVQLSDGRIEVSDPDLKKQLNLSIEDLRFAENLVRQVDAVNASLSEGAYSSSADVFLDGVGWMGGEEWLRHQFKVYLLALMRSSCCPDVSREYEVFNSSFVSAWKETHNYRMWLASGPYPTLNELPPGHPHAGNLSMTDMRIRLSHTIQGLDRGRRLNQTLVNTGTAVVKTREAVGGAITSAKGALTNLWSSMTTGNANSSEKDCPEEAEEAQEARGEGEDEGAHLLQVSASYDVNNLEQVEQGKVALEIEMNSVH